MLTIGGKGILCLFAVPGDFQMINFAGFTQASPAHRQARYPTRVTFFLDYFILLPAMFLKQFS